MIIGALVRISLREYANQARVGNLPPADVVAEVFDLLVDTIDKVPSEYGYDPSAWELPQVLGTMEKDREYAVTEAAAAEDAVEELRAELVTKHDAELEKMDEEYQEAVAELEAKVRCLEAELQRTQEILEATRATYPARVKKGGPRARG